MCNHFSLLVVSVMALVLTPLQDTFALSSHKGMRAKSPLTLTGQELPRPFANSSYPVTYSGGPGDSIFYTRWDFETNGTPNRNLINYADTVISLARMAALVPGHDDRATWNSCSFDGGTTWQPLTRIESTRTGWPNIDQFADEVGAVFIVSHESDGPTLQQYGCPDRCGTVWNGGSTGITTLWPRMAIGEGLGVHVIYSEGVNPVTNVLYSHSPDGGTSWDVVDMNIFTSSGFVPDADGYDITAQGTNVVIVSAGSGGDVILLTSSDGGGTWIEQIVYDIDETLNTPEEVPDGSCSAIYDLSGEVHVVWGNWYSAGDGILYYSVDAGIRHWSSTTGVQEIALPTQDTSIVVPAGGRDGNYASGADIAIDADNNLYVTYSSFISERDVNNNSYEHIFALGSSDGGATWMNSTDVTPGSSFDAAFPSLADRVGQNLHIVYNCDPFAGTAILGDHLEIDVAIMYLQVERTSVITSATTVQDKPEELPQVFELSQNYPNPFNPETTIEYQLPVSARVSLIVSDILGREVATLVDREERAGRKSVSFNGSGLSSGTYFYRLRAGDFVQTRKLILAR
ncbi:MAG: 5'-Nucleotidase domain protein [Bacteroidetes bacterium]|nr:5'-Nucleotidase domain protein [Bacteroidota bacterium]